eukprot:CAMPEP_0172527180 /NCGR_PEP_ID=MMETSP1067-20121228/1932_1 /TAXON_ID=265564 ORGANISM="Thalassiosira punctigera, Strain Tpunct2005C2" /NCGR_SAMPLE_ID=MMETSP1067 /ASSEMBLY_ACC=CAM_ASM_000444 /LENGTH=139 /DNA_ID=CAMNT_0013310861 /DNA_START=566 /DNA_END=985 /DNA_ORIENTATION=+
MPPLERAGYSEGTTKNARWQRYPKIDARGHSPHMNDCGRGTTFRGGRGRCIASAASSRPWDTPCVTFTSARRPGTRSGAPWDFAYIAGTRGSTCPADCPRRLRTSSTRTSMTALTPPICISSLREIERIRSAFAYGRPD